MLSVEPEGRVDLRPKRSRADRFFRGVLFVCSSSVLFVIGAIVVFLLLRATLVWHTRGLRAFTDSWLPGARVYGFRGALAGSIVVAIIALVVALPISIATALAINEYVPRRARGPLTALVDLLAAVPSLVYGLWGLNFLQNHLYLTSQWLGHHADFFPLFRLAGVSKTNFSLFDGGIVVGIMILPLVTAIAREVMSQVPREDCEAALALGGTRWGMVTDVILPFSQNGIIGGAMLGLGRALGETIAVTLVLQANNQATSHILQAGGGTVSALIASNFLSANAVERSALTLAGLTLFAITLAVNIVARIIVNRGRTK